MTVALRGPVARTTGDVRDAAADAVRRGLGIRIVGAGTWLDAGRPVAAPVTLSVAGLSGVVEYVPGDLTLTCGAGTTLAEIARVAAEEHQWLALDPFGTTRGTVGASIATASAGPLAHAFGGPRDNVLGIEFVDGTGAIARGGGRVVKNVAGFDLTRLFTGSWGSLGVITEVTVRLRALPEAEATVALRAPDGEALAALLARVRAAAVVPWALELVDAPLAARLGTTGPALLVHLGGNEEVVGAQRTELAKIADVWTLPGDVWERLARCEPPRAAVVRLARLPSDVARTWSEGQRIAGLVPGGIVHASAGLGVVRCILPGDDLTAVERALAIATNGASRVYERLPAALWPRLAPTAIGDPISAGIKRAFDPKDVFNPGILGESAR